MRDWGKSPVLSFQSPSRSLESPEFSVLARYACLALVTTFAFRTNANAQDANLRVEVRPEGTPVAAADVVLNGTTHATDAEGALTVSIAPGFLVELKFGRFGQS